MRQFPDEIPKAAVCNSWKEIAAYLGRGVRTVQRWEHDLQLPVHRPKGKDRSAVLAFPAELDRWLMGTPLRNQVTGRAGGESRTALVRQSRDLRARANRLLLAAHEKAQSQHLQAEILSKKLEGMITRLWGLAGPRNSTALPPGRLLRG